MVSSLNKTFRDLLKNHIVLNERIIREDIKKISQPGENYFSDIYSIDIVSENLENNVKNSLHAIAKIVSPAHLKDLKDFVFSNFVKEIGFYRDVVPSLLQLQIENNIKPVHDIFPNFLACRNNEHGTSSVTDEHAILVLENLKTKGYSNIDRCIGFDLEGAQLVLKDLATFHALTLALKIKKPNVYETKVKKHCYPAKFPAEKTMKHICSQAWIDTVLNHEKSVPYREQLKRKLDIEFERMDAFFKRPEKEPWATVIHNDMWTNNTMQICENGKLVKNKFVDFQAYIYGSPLCDMVFFIWCSVQMKVVQDHGDELIQHYHRHFIKILEDFGCDTTPFEYEKFLKQLDEVAPHELLHTLYLAAIIYVEKGKQAIDLSNSVDEFMSDSIGKDAADRIGDVVHDFGKRGWIVW